MGHFTSIKFTVASHVLSSRFHFILKHKDHSELILVICRFLSVSYRKIVSLHHIRSTAVSQTSSLPTVDTLKSMQRKVSSWPFRKLKYIWSYVSMPCFGPRSWQCVLNDPLWQKRQHLQISTLWMWVFALWEGGLKQWCLFFEANVLNLKKKSKYTSLKQCDQYAICMHVWVGDQLFSFLLYLSPEAVIVASTETICTSVLPHLFPHIIEAWKHPSMLVQWIVDFLSMKWNVTE